MVDGQSPKAPRMRQARKSIAHLPSSDVGGNKENATLDAAALTSMTATSKQAARKSRSKSIGPGGLDALKEGTGNKGGPAFPLPKSILKPTISLSPLKPIPSRGRSGNASPSKNGRPRTPEASPTKSSRRSAIESEAEPSGGRMKSPSKSPSKTLSQSQSQPRSPARVAVRTEEEQQAAAREKERQDVLAHKEARRKSLANRRVSFAPEATLHTWNVVELPEDSTTSSASTNSTRRASGVTSTASPYNTPGSLQPSSDASEPPSTPPELVEDVQIEASPAHQRDLHQKKRRRSSAASSVHADDPLSSSPFSGDSGDEETNSQAFETADEGSDSSNSDDKDLVEDETVTNVDGDENTIHSTGSTGSSGRLEAALQQAAKQAGTQGIEFDEHGDITMEMADDEVTDAFKPWLKEQQTEQPAWDPSALLDQENINPFSPAFKANVVQRYQDEEDDGTMDMTEAVGGIIPAVDGSQASPRRRRRKSVAAPKKRRSSAGRRRSSGGASNQSDDQTMDLTTAIGGIQGDNPPADVDSADEDEELTMEFTNIIGGVVQTTDKMNESQPNGSNEQENRRQSTGSANGEEDMDFTYADGGILLPSITERTEPSEDETMQMDVTTAIGAILPNELSTRDRGEGKALMELETDVGQLSAVSPFHNGSAQEPMGAGLLDERPLPALQHKEAASPLGNDSARKPSKAGSLDQRPLLVPFGRGAEEERREGKALSELETDARQPPRASPFHDGSAQKPLGAGLLDERPLPALSGKGFASPFHDGSAQKPMGAGLLDERPLPAHSGRAAVASEAGSPSIAAIQNRSSARKSFGKRPSLTPKSRQPTPTKNPGTPSKQLTPQPIRPTTPGKTPPAKNISMRSASPKKLFEAEISSARKTVKDSSPGSVSNSSLFHHDPETGKATPKVVLKPRKRRSSGLGADREGLGSPQVTALLDRRASIGENAKAFVANGNASAGVRFEDPRSMEQEIDQERAEEQRKEDGRGILQDEADVPNPREEQDATANLKDMIESLTPQKKKLKGRKSLHVGAARGLLGKRPAELDADEDDSGSPATFKNREGSPVKRIKLPAPPSKSATTGRATRSTRLSLAETSGNASFSTPSGVHTPNKQNTTPKEQTRFKNAVAKSPAKITPFEEMIQGGGNAVEPSDEEDRIQLQDFLNLTNIRFMELTTTKRRHTMAPNALGDQSARKPSHGEANQPEVVNDLENCVVAGACTVPMLELYQHSCRELKKYISEGRKVAKEIEEATFEDNPPLFREYMSAPVDVKEIMNNQFKNVKTNARLLSKAMWYEWRMKLLDGLKEGLVLVGHGMEEDARLLTQQEQILQPVLPGLIAEHDKLDSQVQVAQSQADELAGCDKEELKDTRGQLAAIEKDLEAKRQMIEELQSRLRDQEDSLEAAMVRKQTCTDEINEARQVLRDCRGWSPKEVSALQYNVSALEASHGWRIISANDLALSMTYSNALQLFFTPSAFLPNDSSAEAVGSGSAPISLTYIADSHEYHPQPLTTEKRFFLQIIRAQLQCLSQSQTKLKDLLSFISSNWDKACSIAAEVTALGVSYITEPTITADEVMAVRSILLLKAMRTKVEATFEVKVQSGEGTDRMRSAVKPSVIVHYGETLNEKKMGEFLESRIKGAKGDRVWASAMWELEDKLIARGKKS